MSARSKAARQILDISDLRPDPSNANRGTDRGRSALEQSLQAYGAGRAVLIDRRGVIIAGNKTVEQAKRLNMPLRVIRTDGKTLVAVQRDDLDLRADVRAKALAIADNRVGELDLEWDVDMLKQVRAEGVDLSAFWSDAEFAAMVSPSAGRTDENAVLEPGETDIVRGELIQLGSHRLLCGDATDARDVVLDFAYYSGWRRREITELTWEEVDLNGSVVRLSPARSKTKVGRLLPVSKPLGVVLERRLKRRRKADLLVFKRDGVTVRRWKTAWRDACRRAGVPGRIFHDCRRTAARNLVRAGVPERVAMLLTGHKTRSVFDRYNIVNERELASAGERLM